MSGGAEEYQAPKEGFEALLSAEGLRAKTPGKESSKQSTESEGVVPFPMSSVPFNVPKSSGSQGGASPCYPLCGLENLLASLCLCFLSPTCELGRMVPASSNIMTARGVSCLWLSSLLPARPSQLPSSRGGKQNWGFVSQCTEMRGSRSQMWPYVQSSRCSGHKASQGPSAWVSLRMPRRKCSEETGWYFHFQLLLQLLRSCLTLTNLPSLVHGVRLWCQ